MVPPVVIITTPRSGSSLLTRIVAQHGLWVGTHATTNGHGYCDYENIELKNFVKAHWRRNASGNAYPAKHIDFRRFISELAPPQQRAVLKGFIPLWRVWVTELPDAGFLFCTRNFEQIVDSAYEKARTPKKHADVSDFLRYWVDQVNIVARLLRRPVINMTDVVNGDYSVLEEALRLCDIRMDAEKVTACIDQKLWRRTKKRVKQCG